MEGSSHQTLDSVSGFQPEFQNLFPQATITDLLNTQSYHPRSRPASNFPRASGSGYVPEVPIRWLYFL